MRLHEISPGQKKTVDLLHADQYQFMRFWNKVIRTKCTESLDAYAKTGEYLYRGIKNAPPALRGSSRTDRIARDSMPEVAEKFDELLAANGMEALRKNSIFATSRSGFAGSFGKIYIIFPIDGFKFTYTTESDIIISSWSYLMDPNVYQDLQSRYSRCREELGPERADEISIRTNWMDWKVEDIEGGLDVLKRMCANDPEIQSLTINKLINPRVFKERYQPQNTNLAYAIKKGFEVYISGQYYAFDKQRYGDQLNLAMRNYQSGASAGDDR